MIRHCGSKGLPQKHNGPQPCSCQSTSLTMCMAGHVPIFIVTPDPYHLLSMVFAMGECNIASLIFSLLNRDVRNYQPKRLRLNIRPLIWTQITHGSGHTIRPGIDTMECYWSFWPITPSSICNSSSKWGNKSKLQLCFRSRPKRQPKRVVCTHVLLPNECFWSDQGPSWPR